MFRMSPQYHLIYSSEKICIINVIGQQTVQKHDTIIEGVTQVRDMPDQHP